MVGEVNQATADSTANCIFCKIVSGEIPSKKIYEDEKVIGILDLYPATPGHIIVIPKQHFMIMPQLPEELIRHISSISKQLSTLILKNLDAKGVNVFIANGAPAGQKAPHFLMHIIPRYENDGMNFMLPEIQINDSELQDLHLKLMAVIQKNDLFGSIGGAKSGGVATQQSQPISQMPPAQLQQPTGQPSQPNKQTPPSQSPQPMQQPIPVQPNNQTPPSQSPQPNNQMPQATAQQPIGPKIPKDQLMQIINSNPELKELIKTQPATVKQAAELNPQLKQLFNGYDVDELSKELNGVSGGPSGGVNLDKISNMLDNGGSTQQDFSNQMPTSQSTQATQSTTQQQAAQPTNQTPQLNVQAQQSPAQSQNSMQETQTSQTPVQQSQPQEPIANAQQQTAQTSTQQPVQPPQQVHLQTPQPAAQNLQPQNPDEKKKKKGVDLDKISNMFG